VLEAGEEVYFCKIAQNILDWKFNVELENGCYRCSKEVRIKSFW
jgi:hypothetical protein